MGFKRILPRFTTELGRIELVKLHESIKRKRKLLMANFKVTKSWAKVSFVSNWFAIRSGMWTPMGLKTPVLRHMMSIYMVREGKNQVPIDLIRLFSSIQKKSTQTSIYHNSRLIRCIQQNNIIKKTQRLDHFDSAQFI